MVQLTNWGPRLSEKLKANLSTFDFTAFDHLTAADLRLKRWDIELEQLGIKLLLIATALRERSTYYRKRNCTKKAQIRFAKYRKTDKRKVALKRYQQSEKGKIYKSNYNRSENAKRAQKKYHSKPKVKEHRKWYLRSFRRCRKLRESAS